MPLIVQSATAQGTFNLFAPELIDHPYPWYQRVLEERVVVYELPNWTSVRSILLSRHADVQAVLRDPRFGRGPFRQNVSKILGDGALARSYRLWFLFQDPPHHARLRALVSKAFTPRHVEALRGQIQALVDALLDDLAAESSFDLIARFAYWVPVMVICELLGVPPDDRGRFSEWSRALANGLDSLSIVDPEVVMHGNAAAAGLTDYFGALAATRRQRPGDDLLSGMIQAEDAGDRLSEDELLATCVLLFFAGHETTVNLIGNGMLALLQHPEELDKLRQHPALIGDAVEELLRYDSPVQRNGRIALADATINGIDFRKDDRVNMLLGAANRDPSQFDDPDRLDISRPNASQHLSFAAGIHYCVGAPLARLEAQLAIGSLIRRMPDLRLASDTPRWRQTFVLRGLQSLEVTRA